MNLSVAITGLVLLSAFIVPVIIYNVKTKNKKNQKINLLKTHFSTLGMELGEYDLWGDHIIGADKKSDMVIYIGNKASQQKAEMVDLSRVKMGESRNTAHSVDAKGRNELISDAVGILIIFSDESTGSKYLEFFDSNQGAQLDNELLLVRKWVDIINSKTVRVRKMSRYKKAV